MSEAHIAHGSLLASAARTATATTPDIDSGRCTGVILFLDVTADSNATETLAVSIQAKDVVSGNYVTLTAFGTVADSTTPGTFAYTLYPGGAETAAVSSHEVQSLVLPKIWRARVTHSAASSWTYSLGYALVP